MAVRIAELDRDLHAGAPAALEMDRHVMLAQMVARAHHLIQGRDLERHMVQAAGAGFAAGRLEQRDAVMVGVAAQEHRAARHHVVAVDVGDLETQHVGVEARASVRGRLT